MKIAGPIPWENPGIVASQDIELAEAFARGEAAALAQVDGWLTRAASAFRRRLGADWEDVLQEVRVEALRLLRQGSFRGDSSLRTYLWQVTAHTCIDALRRRARRPVLDPLDADGPIPSAEASPLDRVLARETHRAFLAVRDAVSRECRELWDLILQGLGYREIGVRLGVSEGALRVRALRCRRHAAELAGRNAAAPRTPNG
jgi:RNA polymerase sigma-70 factor, ECF subfamily